MKPRLGWLGPAIIVAGAAVAAVGVWWMIHARPSPGAVLDVIPIDDDAAFVVRAQQGSDRAFVELRGRDGALRWQALVPPYAGRPGAPGLAWNPRQVTVRVIRDGRPEIFALAIHDATKIGGIRLAPDRPPSPTGYTLDAAVTLGDGERGFELIGDASWHELVAIKLAGGVGLWRVDLGAEPIDRAGLSAGAVWVAHGATVRAFAAETGTPVPPPPVAPAATSVAGQPAGALTRQPYHVTGHTLWVAYPDHVEAIAVR
jgi:hypothetical protein